MAPFALAVDTAGAVGREQCLDHGLSVGQLRWLVASGRWQSPLPRVYVIFSGPIPLETMQFVALLYAGNGATLSHESAAHYWRLGRAPALIHLTVAYPRHVASQPGLAVHRSRNLREHDVHPTLNPRRTRIERTVVDLLLQKESAVAALGLVADAVRERFTTAERIRQALDGQPGTRWSKELREALPDLRAGAHSVLEIRDARIRRRHGLPMGVRQARRLGDGTEYLDVLVEEWQLHVELDGRLGHDRAREIWRDMRRDNRSELARMRQLRYGWADLFDRPCEVAREQAVVLRQQGWNGTFRRCPKCPTGPV